MQRHVLAAVLLVAMPASGNAGGTPQDRLGVPATPPADATVASAEQYYRMSTTGRRSAPEDGVTVTAMERAAVTPGTTAWLGRGSPAEPLASSYVFPHAARKEIGFSYTSDGRLNAYLAERAREPYDAQHPGGSSNCCSNDGATAAPGVYEAKGGETRAVTSLLAQLKTRGLKLALDDGWKISAGARGREYSNAFLNSRVGHITIQRWWGDFSTAYSFQLEKRGGWNVAPSQSIQLGYALAPRSTVAVSYTAGQELAFFGQRGVLKTEVRSLALQAEHAVEKDWSLRLDAGYYDHAELASHRVLRVAFQRRLW